MRWTRVFGLWALAFSASVCPVDFAITARGDEPALTVKVMTPEPPVVDSEVQFASRDGDIIPQLAAAQVQPAVPPERPTLPETQIIAAPPTQQYADAVRLPSILQGTIFDARPVVGYNAPSSTVGSIIDLPALSFPGTVNTVTSQLRADQQAISLDDMLRNIGGAVQNYSGGLNFQDAFYLRGLEMQSNSFRKDGYLDPTYTPRDFANVERVDVLKGPSSVLYGASYPAGTMNLVTKKPIVDQRFTNGGWQYGSYGLQRYTADANGTIGNNQNLLFRVNAAYQNNDSFRQFGFNERVFVAPVLTWVINEDAALTYQVEYHSDQRRYDSGIIAVNGNPYYFSRNTFFGDPNDYMQFHDYRSTLTYKQQLTDTWALTVGESSVFYDSGFTGTIPNSGAFNPVTGTPVAGTLGPTGLYQGGLVTRSRQIGFTNESNHDLIANLGGVWETNRAKHNLLFGTEQTWLIANSETFSQSLPYIPNTFFAPPPAYFALDPTYAINPFTPGPYPATGVTPNSFVLQTQPYRQNRHGFYAQDLIEIGPQLKLLIGGRWDNLNQTYGRNLLISGTPLTGFPIYDQSSYQNGTGRVGLVYELIPDVVSVYGLYAQSFNPPTGANFGMATQPLQPELGTTWEGGVKTQLLDNLTYTVGGFYIQRSNVATQLDTLTIVQTDSQRSQGVDMNLTGQFTQRWSVVANWAYNDVSQSAATGTSSLAAGRVRGVPFDTANIWSRYNLLQVRDRTVGTAFGYVHVGDRRGDYGSDFRLPAYDRFDMGFYYTKGQLNASIYWENITNVDYFVSSINQFQALPGMPSSMRGQIAIAY